MPLPSATQSLFVNLRNWARHHGGEFLWAAVFAVVFGVPAALYFAYYVIDLPPYKIYIVTGSHYLNRSQDTSLDTIQQFKSSLPKLKIADVDVSLEVVELTNDDPATAESMARELVGRDDTLLVIGHLDSGPTEASLPVYFRARPQVPFVASVQTDDGLLGKACKEEPNKKPEDSSCYDGLKPLPYLQLSPTNLEQARWAVRFATEHSKHRFLIIENDEFNKPYSESLAADYSRAMSEYNHEINEKNRANHSSTSTDQVLTGSLVQMEILSDEILWREFKDDEVDCLLYAGGFDGTDSLLKQIVGLKKDHLKEAKLQNDHAEAAIADRSLMVILDDSVVEQRLGETAFELSPVNITDQADAADYSSGLSVYGLDAIAIAKQLINDLNRRGFDWRFRVKKLFHRQRVEDARRNLVSVMQENFAFRSSYSGSERTAMTLGSPTVYAFDGYMRVNGMFHVWERAKSDKGYETVDVDRWHPLKSTPNRSAAGDKNARSGIELKASN
jgi:hypothetical protein